MVNDTDRPDLCCWFSNEIVVLVCHSRDRPRLAVGRASFEPLCEGFFQMIVLQVCFSTAVI